jgi:hypothetical protein
MSPSQAKLQTLSEIEGYENPTELLNAYIVDSVCPGMYMNPNCDYTTEVEPDSSNGWCEDCETNTVKSAMILAGVI